MAYDEGLVQIMRNDLCDVIGISEKKMFGGLAWLPIQTNRKNNVCDAV